ncbi:hypothetical protein OG417_50425 [Actinoallomurus sp. NBC_01490]|uniref:hypothetical protein n=1 Tax=Actinoallomurus sp. NBC_01490 TaxID=2903557 RepID=UPI002E367098|nr:hypothetical protein [Actinoallomurus sp. NBC_01490]
MRNARGDNLTCFSAQRGQFGRRTLRVVEPGTGLDGRGSRTFGHEHARAQEFLALTTGGPGCVQQRRKTSQEFITVERRG